jgi:hypothetical protein
MKRDSKASFALKIREENACDMGCDGMYKACLVAPDQEEGDPIKHILLFNENVDFWWSKWVRSFLFLPFFRSKSSPSFPLRSS